MSDYNLTLGQKRLHELKIPQILIRTSYKRDMKTCATMIPIHGNMVIAITDVQNPITEKDVKKLRKIFNGLSFVEVESLLENTKFSDRVKVSEIQNSSNDSKVSVN